MRAVCYYKNFEKMYDIYGESGDVRFVDIDKFSGEIEHNAEKIYIEEENSWIREVYRNIGIDVELVFEINIDEEVKTATKVEAKKSGARGRGK